MSNLNPIVIVDDVYNEVLNRWDLLVESTDQQTGLAEKLIIDRKSSPEEIADKFMRDAWFLEEDTPDEHQDNFISEDIEFLKASARNVPGLKK